MNEQIHQLMRQAQSEAYAKASAKKKTNSPQNNTVWNEFPEVFAELLIKECMNLVKDCYAEPESGQSPHQTVCASTIIEEHFGVEE